MKDNAVIVPTDKGVKEKKVSVNELSRRVATNFVETYCNNANVVGTFFDIRLVFSVISQSFGPEQEVTVEDRASVTMSWEHAKALRDLLDSRVKLYEQTQGPIRATPDQQNGS